MSSIDVQLRNESGEIVAEVCDSKGALSQVAQENGFSSTRLLRYLMPWGDAIFNEVQGPDLANDIAAVKKDNPSSPLLQVLTEIEPLVERLANEIDLYLWFVGD